MGVVYRARDPELDRDVALKLLLPELHEDVAGGDGQLRLQREARAMARLSHPNVVSVFDIGTVGDQWFVAMELVDGRTLTRWLEEESRPVDEILDVFTQAGRGLSAAHAIGLVHRDFKPDNVLVGKEGRPRVTDFGLARRAGAVFGMASGAAPTLDDFGSISRSGTIAGTPLYMAPEQFVGGPVSAQTDQFSFCVALWHALHGERPFEASDIPSLASAVLQGRVRPPSSRVPEEVTKAMSRGLNPAPEQRFPTMDELLAAIDLKRLERAERERVTVSFHPPPDAPPQRRWIGKPVWALLALSVAALVGSAVLFAQSHSASHVDAPAQTTVATSTPPVVPPVAPQQEVITRPSVQSADETPNEKVAPAVPKETPGRAASSPRPTLPATPRNSTGTPAAPPAPSSAKAANPFDMWK
jgi:serine/threonine protein kinase